MPRLNARLPQASPRRQRVIRAALRQWSRTAIRQRRAVVRTPTPRQDLACSGCLREHQRAQEPDQSRCWTTRRQIGRSSGDGTIECPATPSFTSPTASDTCDTSTVVEDSDTTAAGTCANTYTRTKTWHAVDNCGNTSAQVHQTITVVDTTAPYDRRIKAAMPRLNARPARASPRRHRAIRATRRAWSRTATPQLRDSVRTLTPGPRPGMR